MNDPSQSRYTNTVLMPYLKRSWRLLQLRLHLNDASALRESSAAIVVTATQPLIQPVDLIEPIQLLERLNGSQDSYQLMDRTEFETDLQPTDRLRYWTWREDTIIVPTATTERQVKIRYLKSATAIGDVNSFVALIDADLYLAPMTASFAARYVGENFTRGHELKAEAESHLDEIIRRNVKKRQSMPSRRRSFSRWVRRYY